MCGVSDQTIRRWIKQGYFPGVRRSLGVTSPYRVPRVEVEAFITRRLEERGGGDFELTVEEHDETK
ncbi:MAG TPA: DNA-binding protein [Chloroflexi bacterium]|nr:DNA-binding protein [Chloroflexota bacterium]